MLVCINSFFTTLAQNQGHHNPAWNGGPDASASEARAVVLCSVFWREMPCSPVRRSFCFGEVSIRPRRRTILIPKCDLNPNINYGKVQYRASPLGSLFQAPPLPPSFAQLQPPALGLLGAQPFQPKRCKITFWDAATCRRMLRLILTSSAATS
ncbi:hypothetical protein V496_10579 [Pseudogymnoascus sp. VKM F-4515 (FW-2607)]|nr:hypothetical protein V496_10579 [Pseudogymnoascus sp. VKM F-4515 (FW-2607)]